MSPQETLTLELNRARNEIRVRHENKIFETAMYWTGTNLDSVAKELVRLGANISQIWRMPETSGGALHFDLPNKTKIAPITDGRIF